MKKYTFFIALFISLLAFNASSASAQSSTIVEIPTAQSSLSNYIDATPAFKNGIESLRQSGGGTLFVHPGKYMVKETIELPSNITVECAGASEIGPCIIALGASQNLNANNMSLFSITPGAQNVKIQNVELRSMTPGWQVYPRYDLTRIRDEKTTAVRMGDRTGNAIRNIQFENVRMVNFTYGINVGPQSGTSNPVVENVKIRNVASYMNYLALRVNSLSAQNWDIQNLNVVEMSENQNGILLERTGKMSFLQLSCASTLHNANNCVDIGKRSGAIYFRQAHSEGPREAFRLREQSTAPIYLDNSAFSGVVEAKNTLYIFSNRSWSQFPNSVMRFTGGGTDSTVYSCANVLTNGQAPNTTIDITYPGLRTQPQGCNFDVTAINNSFATGASTFNLKSVVTRPDTSRAMYNVKNFGAKGDGVTDDTEAIKNALRDAPGTWSRSLLFFPAGRYRVSNTIKIDAGTILQGEAGTIIELTTVNKPLFQIRVTSTDPVLKRGIHIKNMVLRSTGSNPELNNTTAIEFSGNRGASTDHSFNKLEISGFTRGILVRNDSGNFDSEQPMVDTVAVRDINLINNYRGIEIRSQNASGWNLENINITKMKPKQIGVVVNGIGHIAIRGLNCEGELGISAGVDRRADACLSLVRHSGAQVENLRAKNVKLAVHAPWEIGWTPFPTVIRNSDLTEGFYAAGTLFMLSVSNTYATPSYASDSGVTQLGSRSVYFNDYWSDNPNNAFPGKESKITSCGDRFINPNTQIAGEVNFVGLRLPPQFCAGNPAKPVAPKKVVPANTEIKNIIIPSSSSSQTILGAEKFNFTLLLRKGSTGNEVMELQKFLNGAGYDAGIVDGNFGPRTHSAVVQFQSANGLTPDGIVGGLTRAVLNK